MAAVIDPQIIIRDMTLADLTEVMAIEQTSYPFPWTKKIFSDCLRVGYRCLVIEMSEQLVGYAIISVVLDECHILNICIGQAARGQGLGRLMMESVLRQGSTLGAKMVYLEVRPSNIIANQLYESLGFQQIGLRKGYYPHHDGREDALVLALVFDDSDYQIQGMQK